MPKKVKGRLSFTVRFQGSPKKAADRRKLFKELRSLIEQERESLPFKDIKLEKNLIFFTTKELAMGIRLEKPLSMRGLLVNPEDNIQEGNDLTNKLVSYINTVFGDYAKGARISSDYFSPWKKTETNIVKKIIGERRIAKMNDHIKATLNPISIIFAYSSKNREYLISPLHREKERGMGIHSTYTYKNALPWDLLSSEYSVLVDCGQILDKISSVEI